MAQESCDLNKDEAEILKPSSSSSPSSSPTTTSPAPATAQMPEPPPPQSTPPAAAAVAQFLPKTCEGILIEASKKRKLAEAITDANAGAAVAAEPLSPVLFVNRCNVCRKRVGLTGFRCRCGELFCPRHRHSETHECSFDYKTAGREEIARANPVIKAAKIIKI
ncbi:hypothetical protein ABZP36_028518 [Zizania latifolia]